MTSDSFERLELIKYFRDEANELLARLDTDLLLLEATLGSAADPEIVASVFRALHTIKGNAGMLDFFDVARVAHTLENVVDLVRNGRVELTGVQIQLLFEGRDILTAAIRTELDGVDAPIHLRDFLVRLESAVKVSDESGLALEFSPAVDEQMAQAVVDAFLAAVPAPPADLQAPVGPPIPAPLPPLRAGPPPAPPPQPPRAATPPPKTQTAVKSETVRVDVDRLDLLMNLVGELVINRTRISDIATTLARVFSDRNVSPAAITLARELGESAALLARTTNEIQESVMKVRMIPIGTVFERFPRLVRDLARSRNKEVDLVIEGAETDLDKTIVDHIGEPLLHLVRNCIDHGIEEPRVREARGKARAGKIRLRAFHEGNQIIIEVQDDGAGIDLAKVRERAVRLGLMTENDTRSERELLQLIFFPGFTTSDHVDDVSGRGVGMDVVKRTILSLKGLFETDSVRDAGTKFTIKLPLTLAIIQALLVSLGEELYAIPLDAVVESQRVDPGEIRTLHGGEVITVRGAVVPLIRLTRFLGGAPGRQGDKVMIVIVGVSGRQVGLVVDGFQGEQEIVIKPLSDAIGRIPGISGATILGNGSISLILDIHTLVQSVYEGAPGARAEFSGV
jgi:two-component system chemotaxis sensor kinase CheA